jgi:methylglutaconyl-CoA hydratase
VFFDVDRYGVATVTIKRPDVHNAINQQVIDELVGIMLKLKRAKDVRLVVLTGEGRSFSAGADLEWMKSMKNFSMSKNMAESRKLAMLYKEINDFTKPVIAKVQGGALGGGAGLVAVCDYVLASKDAVFAFSEVRLGIVPAVISPFVIAKIGESHARALFLSGMRFTAERAKEIGLVHEVASADALDKRLDQVVKEFLKAAPEATMEAKQLILDVMEMKQDKKDDKALMEFTCKTIARLRVSKEGQEGMEALLAKRDPYWVE